MITILKALKQVTGAELIIIDINMYLIIAGLLYYLSLIEIKVYSSYYCLR